MTLMFHSRTCVAKVEEGQLLVPSLPHNCVTADPARRFESVAVHDDAANPTIP
ncbi:hypothetical protein [Tabrizicola sp.]|uniref:hypothetical protein n=1 Tax=Tabrizicola sp. TaxID=2005166 RepID=UPI003F3E87F0